MTDYRSLEYLEVFRNEAQVATLRRRPRGCEFTYEPNFLTSSEPAIALHLPKTSDPLRTEGLLNLPTFFAGLVPEGVMFAAAQTLIGSARDDLFSVLAATGRDAIGDIDVRVPGSQNEEPHLLNLANARDVIELILSRRGGQVDAIAAIPGVQAKMSVGGIVRATRGARYIAKFPPLEYAGLPENEAACMRLAQKCGIKAPRATIKDGVFVVERFDREFTRAGSIHKVHVEDMLQAMDLFPNSKYSLDFVEICEAMERLGVSTAGTLEFIRLYAFSYIIGNGDLHAKNLSLIRKSDGQWVPSPAYDLISTLPYKSQLVGAESMALALADESFGRFELREFIEFGTRFGVSERATRKEIISLANRILKNGPAVLEAAIPAEDLDTILSRASSLAT